MLRAGSVEVRPEADAADTKSMDVLEPNHLRLPVDERLYIKLFQCSREPAWCRQFVRDEAGVMV